MADSGYLEKRQFERVTAQIKVRYHELDEAQADQMIKANIYKDITHPGTEKPKAFKDVMTVVTENISVGGLKLVADKPFTEGRTLSVEMDLPGVPMAIKAIAVVVRAMPVAEVSGKFTGGLRFMAINKEDVAKVERYIALQKRAEIEKKASRP